ncbi:hypothetical protein [Thiocapsa roseopersicina]|uniref:Uncharacterized protein n=1 Tax=Thiocapsa roseopersicina TaxID=1058 RepID=A0A1H2ZME0_THIRO|nr:hypothetical protein [Thiocapsa roseopersicina]SDX18620.1 hypothetical protein SAMN05421783_11676 [Thiocapsa roseopersicina]
MILFKLPVKLILLVLTAIAAGVLWQQAQLSVLALSRIDPVPETRAMVAEERYADAAGYLDFFMAYDYVNQDPAARALHAEIQSVRDSLSYQAGKLSEGLISGSSDENIGRGAGVITDLFVIGDIRDLANQATKFVQGEDVDEVVTALASIGLVATGAQLASIGATAGTAGAAAPTVAASTTAKGGIIILKAARKLGKLPPWLGKAIIKGAKTVKQTKKLDAVTDLFNDVYRLAKTRGGLTLLSKTTDAASLRRMAKLADTFGDQTATLYRIGGNSFVRAAGRAGDLGVDSIKVAATYGKGGLQVLDKVGALKFAKFTARGSKIAYKGDVVQLLARLFLKVPDWVLYLLVALGAFVWVPWRWLGRLRRTTRQIRVSIGRSVARSVR